MDGVIKVACDNLVIDTVEPNTILEVDSEKKVVSAPNSAHLMIINQNLATSSNPQFNSIKGGNITLSGNSLISTVNGIAIAAANSTYTYESTLANPMIYMIYNLLPTSSGTWLTQEARSNVYSQATGTRQQTYFQFGWRQNNQNTSAKADGWYFGRSGITTTDVVIARDGELLLGTATFPAGNPKLIVNGPVHLATLTAGDVLYLDANKNIVGEAKKDAWNKAFGTGSDDVARGNHTHTQYVENVVTSKGDLIAGTGVGTVARLGPGTDGQLLACDSSESTGLKWVNPAIVTVSLQSAYNGGQQILVNSINPVVFKADTGTSNVFNVKDSSDNTTIQMKGDGVVSTAYSGTDPNPVAASIYYPGMTDASSTRLILGKDENNGAWLMYVHNTNNPVTKIVSLAGSQGMEVALAYDSTLSDNCLSLSSSSDTRLHATKLSLGSGSNKYIARYNATFDRIEVSKQGSGNPAFGVIDGGIIVGSRSGTPSNPHTGTFFFDDQDGKLKVYTGAGTGWKTLAYET